MESETELKINYLKNSENVLSWPLSKKELQISKDDLKFVATQGDELKTQMKQKHAENMTKFENTIQTIELLKKENGILREENN